MISGYYLQVEKIFQFYNYFKDCRGAIFHFQRHFIQIFKAAVLHQTDRRLDFNAAK